MIPQWLPLFARQISYKASLLSLEVLWSGLWIRERIHRHTANMVAGVREDE
jgi:hypothetical protein